MYPVFSAFFWISFFWAFFLFSADVGTEDECFPPSCPLLCFLDLSSSFLVSDSLPCSQQSSSMSVFKVCIDLRKQIEN